MVLCAGRFDLPERKWQLTTDIKGRGGFIRTLNERSSCKKDDNAKLILTLNSTVAEIISKNQTILFSMYYLRSYTNAGMPLSSALL